MSNAQNSHTSPVAERQLVLTLGCPDTTGIVARLSTFIANHGGWITEADYFTDPDSGWFFTRQAVRAESLDTPVEEFRAEFDEIATEFGPGARWRIWDTARRKRAVILVSKEGHCLHDLLGRVDQNDYPMDVAAVIGNHEDLRVIAENHGVPFHHVPFPKDAVGKRASFDRVAELVNEHEPDAVVLARFMQILPPDLCEMWEGRAINIHHSFLPSFMGARPYHQAYKRGVKLIGATCHYATSALDDGPIIEQDVIRITHKDTPADMQRLGRDAEKLVLARGLRFHLEDRVQVYGNRTVVFD
ncbi:formyltetrahydrofolate deformylase [Corynebacterium meridianum]|uniref:Formyltetrahydrofolate deformylase n=1 Tax=Corynebacterium meridianum TaxID=2765363 RepID=A0A934M5B4_9CORY|nr:formyltetrahydrofolate deformylase [Corynebacterium meridianum]MBI8989946.1 formyltetrahydrofolate deformylase [Corynebacterium meridianum]MCK7677638.1 formyltetrahydrofolate deformylase [Corynebacterium meridianum]